MEGTMVVVIIGMEEVAIGDTMDIVGEDVGILTTLIHTPTQDRGDLEEDCTLLFKECSQKWERR